MFWRPSRGETSTMRTAADDDDDDAGFDVIVSVVIVVVIVDAGSIVCPVSCVMVP